MDRIETIKRLQSADRKRIQSWTDKTQGSPLAADLWKEDLELYEAHQKNNALMKHRHEQLDAKIMGNRARKLAKACAEVDELDMLRKERKKLVESEKELKARMDLEKVNKRLAFASKQQDEFKEHLENNLRKRGTLMRAHSDFFTDELVDGEEKQEEDEEAKEAFQAQARNSLSRHSLLGSLEAPGEREARGEDDSLSRPMSMPMLAEDGAGSGRRVADAGEVAAGPC